MKKTENQILNELLKDSIASIVHEAVSEVIDKITQEKLNNNYNQLVIEDEFIEVKEASKITKLKVNTLYDYVKKRIIPHIKVSRKILFNKSELIEWLNSKRVRTKLECDDIIKNGKHPLL